MEEPITVGRAFAVAASYYLQSSARSKLAGDNEQAEYAYELGSRIRDYARQEYARKDI